MDAVSLSGRVYYRADGKRFPITRFYDADGEECEPEDAVAFLAGAGDEWIYDRLSGWETVATRQ